MGFYTMAFSLAFIIGPWMGTMILERFGGIVLWSSMFVLGAFAALLLASVREETVPALPASGS